MLFALTPTFYGVENTLLHIPDNLFGPGLDGWATFLAPLTSLPVFVAVALLRPGGRPRRPNRRPQRRERPTIGR